ncbi:Alpha/Beta hydrolase protein [Trichoderma barbatum]
MKRQRAVLKFNGPTCIFPFRLAQRLRNKRDEFVDADGIKFAYRRLGSTDGVPLVLIMHCRGTMDHWDPALIDPLAAKRPVILIDTAGSGRSQGNFPPTMARVAQYFINIITKLGLEQVDIMGFSGCGCNAQMIALNSPKLIRHLILSATTPSIGKGVQIGPANALQKLRTAVTAKEHKSAFISTFFTSSARSQAAGHVAWDRITTGRQNRCDYASLEAAEDQGVAYFNFIDPNNANDGSYDAGHGFLYQYADMYAALVNDFLDRQ